MLDVLGAFCSARTGTATATWAAPLSPSSGRFACFSWRSLIALYGGTCHGLQLCLDGHGHCLLAGITNQLVLG